MLARLVRKELFHHLMDFRFVSVFVFCMLLSILGVTFGTRSYLQQLHQYNVVSERNREVIQGSLKQGNDMFLRWAGGYRWNRRPEALSPMVYGLSGTLGQEVRIQYQGYFPFEASFFSTDPIYALFGVLDLAYIVKIVLSLCVLLFTYDAICGEKDGGTLRLCSSFPVPRSTVAQAKLIGSVIAVLVPFLIAFLLSSLVLATGSGLHMRGDDWGRIVALLGVFALYLTVFAGFGIWASALTHRPVSAFLGILGIWAIWTFAVPGLAVDTARRLRPARSAYELERGIVSLGEEIRTQRQAEIQTYWQRNPVKDWNALGETRRRELLEGDKEIGLRWDTTFYVRLNGLRTEWRNQKRSQQELAIALSTITPVNAVSLVSMDLARTGLSQQERIETALDAHLIYLTQFIRERQTRKDAVLADFSLFTHKDYESLGECLSRNVFHILNLALLAILGFAAAYVAILRYDVR